MLNQVWYQVVNVGLCGDSFSGLYEIWLCIVITNTLLFVALCIASVLFVQFDHKYDDATQLIPVEDEDFQYVDGEYVNVQVAPSAPGYCAMPGESCITIPNNCTTIQMTPARTNKQPEYNLYGVIV
jgi:hypothetical protein